MSESKFTKGPYRVEGPPGDKFPVAPDACCLWDDRGRLYNVADAYLFAAAPDLYAACEAVARNAGLRGHHLGCECNGVGDSGLTCREMMDRLRTALKRARGEES